MYGVNFNELKYMSIYFYIFNILSVKANQIYNYPMIYDTNKNLVPVYSIYGYDDLTDDDIKKYTMYIISFNLIWVLIYIYGFNKTHSIFLS
jgi:hypothetical protein